MAFSKISLIGSGQIGGTLALLAARQNIKDVVLFDVIQGTAKGKALDLNQMSSLLSSDCNFIGTDKYIDIKDSDVCIVTAGFPRIPGMSRDDLLKKNLEVIKDVSFGIKTYAPNAFVIIVTNPLDVMVYAFFKLSNFNKNKVVGMAGVLDSARFCNLLSSELNVSRKDINALVLGGHGDEMVPLVNFSNVAGIPLSKLVQMGILKQQKLNEIIKKTRYGGSEIVKFLGTGSAFYAPAFSAMEIANSYLYNEKRLLPCASMLEGEYGVNGLFIGVPIIIGHNGVEKILELELSSKEKSNFKSSVLSVQKIVNKLDMLI